MFDYQRLVDSITEAAEQGVKASLEDIRNDARRRAPVRKLFKGGGRRSVTAHIGVHNHAVTGKPYQLARRVAGLTLGGSPLRGSQNTSVPTTRRLRAFGGQRLAGSADHTFREVKRVGNDSFTFASTKARFKIGGKSRLIDVHSEINRRARYDVSRGRGINASAGGVTEFGGTLRDSIQVEGPTRSGYRIVGYVVASAIEHGFNYAYAQEFGTAHNAPQPFLRPALRNFFARLGAVQQTSIKTHLERRPHPVRLIASEIELVLSPTGSFGATGSGSALVKLGNKLDRAFG